VPGTVAATRTRVARLTQSLALRQKQTSIEQKFSPVRVSSLHASFTQKCCELFLLRLLPANALASGTLLAIG
jgi:hypothetical protein